MKRLTFILGLFFMSMDVQTAFAQNLPNANDSIFTNVETPPMFDGGEAAMFKYIAEQVVYPDSALAQGAQGKVYCEFVVEKDGSLSNIKVVRSSKNEWLDDEAVRVVSTMPQWKAGTISSQPVRTRYFLPVTFKIHTQPARKTDEIIGEDADNQVIKVAEKMPEFPGGQQALFEYLRANVRYPSIAQKNGIQGTSIIQFVVNKDGSITDIIILRSAGDQSLDLEAMRVVHSMPNWSPGLMKGRPVRVTYTVPINFKLNDTNIKKTNAAKVLQAYLDKHFEYEPIKSGINDIVRLDINIPLFVSIDSTGLISSITKQGNITCEYRIVNGRETKEVMNGVAWKTQSKTIFDDNTEIVASIKAYEKNIRQALEEFIPTMNDAHIYCTPTKEENLPINETIAISLHRDGLKKYKVKKQ